MIALLAGRPVGGVKTTSASAQCSCRLTYSRVWFPDEARCDSTRFRREEGARLPSRGRVRHEMSSQSLFHQRHCYITTARHVSNGYEIHGHCVCDARWKRLLLGPQNLLGEVRKKGSSLRGWAGAQLVRKRLSSLDWIRLPIQLQFIHRASDHIQQLTVERGAASLLSARRERSACVGPISSPTPRPWWTKRHHHTARSQRRLHRRPTVKHRDGRWHWGWG